MPRLLGALAVMSAVSSGVKTRGENPVKKVVTLLTEMKDEVDLNMKKDMASSKKLQCWAQENRDRLDASIEEAENQVKALTGEIESQTGVIDEKTAQIKTTEEEIAATEDSIASSRKKRDAEAETFRKEDLDFQYQIRGLKSAIKVLSKHNQKENLLQVRRAVSAASAAYPKKALLQEAQSMLTSLTQPGSTGNMAYSSQSGEIFGILQQIQEEMEADHTEMSATEEATAKNYSILKTTQQEKLQKSNKQLNNARVKKTEAEEKRTVARQNKITEAQKLEADKAFLEVVNEKAAADLKEATSRFKAYNEEIKAIGDTVDILNSYEGDNHFAKMSGGAANFLQTSRLNFQRDARARAAAVLRAQGSPKLALLATQTTTKLNAFTAILEKVDNLITDLGKNKETEVAKRDACLADMDENDKAKFANDNLLEDLSATIGSLEHDINTLEGEIKEINEDYKARDIAFAGATNQRIEENQEFAQIFKDNEISQRILGDAKFRLAQFYGFVQVSEDPPAGLKAGGQEKSGSGQGVIQLLDQIITDSKTAVQEAKKAEQTRQTEYEEMVVAHKADQKIMKKDLAEKMELKATKDKELAVANEDQKAAVNEAKAIVDTKNALGEECNFLLENFDTRQAGFASEIEALKEAKQILKGMS